MPLSSRVSDLTSFDLLLSVAKLGSIGRAAAAHRLYQPAASARLRQLEHQVGARLLERGARGARLTTIGELVAGWAQPAVIPWLIAPHGRRASGPISAGCATISDSAGSTRATTHTVEL